MRFLPLAESLEVRMTPTDLTIATSLVPVTAQILVPVQGAPKGTTQPFLDPRPYMTDGYALYPKSTEVVSPSAIKFAMAMNYFTGAIPALPISPLS